jgi:hypothetical protein
MLVPAHRECLSGALVLVGAGVVAYSR